MKCLPRAGETEEEKNDVYGGMGRVGRRSRDDNPRIPSLTTWNAAYRF